MLIERTGQRLGCRRALCRALQFGVSRTEFLEGRLGRASHRQVKPDCPLHTIYHSDRRADVSDGQSGATA